MRNEILVNAFFILLHSLNYKLTRRRIPLMVSLGLTNRCNLDCPFCYAKGDKAGILEPSLQELIDRIGQFIKLGTRIFLLQGGEPLLRKDLKDIIRYIKSKKRFCRISTNGVLVADRIDALTDIDQISFSLDGNEEVADSIRGKGVYKQVARGMNEAFRRKIPFEIHASLIRKSAQNKDSIAHLLELAKKYKTYVSFCVTSVTGAEHTSAVGSGDLTQEEIKEFYRHLIELKKKGLPVSNTFNSLRKTLDWPLAYSEIGFKYNLPAGFKYTQCRHARLICWLDASGVLYSCPIGFYREGFGVKVKEDNIKRAWDELGKSVKCASCGGSDESTTFFALKAEDLRENFLKVYKTSLSRAK